MATRSFTASVNRAATPRDVVPILYGRRVIPGIGFGRGFSTVSDRYVLHLALCEGKIGGVEAWYVNGERQTANAYVNGVLRSGIWYRAGSIGLPGIDSGAETEGAAMLRPQVADHTDPLNGSTEETRQAYSRLAYATAMPPTNLTGVAARDEPDPEYRFVVRGTECGIYDDEGTLLSTAWTASPVWQVVDLLLHPRRGAGRVVAVADLDWPSVVSAADYCDVESESSEAVTALDVDVNNTTRVVVGSTRGFFRGMRIEIGGNSRTVVDLEPKILYVDSAIDIDAPQVVQGFQKRFESHAYFDSPMPFTEMLADLLATFRGTIAQNNGKLAILVDQPQGTSQGHFRDSDYAAGYGIVRGSFRWRRTEEQRHVNHVVVRFENEAHEGTTVVDEATATDWDSVARAGERATTYDLLSVATRDQASRVAQYELRKRQARAVGATFRVGPIGLKLQIGDKIQVTHAVANWAAKECSVRRTAIVGLGDQDELCAELEVDTYDATAYVDDATVPGDGRGIRTKPPLTLTAERVLPDEIELSWVLSGLYNIEHWSLYRSHASMGSPPALVVHERVGTYAGPARLARYKITTDDEGETLYFVLRGVSAQHEDLVSAEVVVTPQSVTEAADAVRNANLAYGGDFPDNAGWEEVDSAPTIIRPNADVADPDSDAALTNPGNARDANDTTYATGHYQLSGETETRQGSIYSFASTGAKVVRPFLRKRHEATGAGGGWEWLYRIDAGAWAPVPGAGSESGVSQRSAVVYGPLLELADMADLELLPRSRAFGPVDCEGDVLFYSVGVEEAPAAPYFMVSGNRAVSKALTDTWVPLSRPYPGNRPLRVVRQFRAGRAYLVQVQLRRGTAAAPDGALEVCVWNADTKTEIHTALRIDAGDYDQVTSNWRCFACVWRPGVDLSGQLRLLLRAKSTHEVEWDRLAVYEGARFRPAGPSITEIVAGYFWDESAPAPSESDYPATVPEGPDEWVVLECT